MKSIKIFAPATVANVGCGFDIFGFALCDIGDVLTLSLTEGEGIIIHPVVGYDDLPTDPTTNVAGVAIQTLLNHLDQHQGFEIILEKNVMPGSGLGSSASSAAAAVYAANLLLGSPCTTVELVAFAMQGERVASGKAHADNVAPSLLGGFTLVRGYDPLDIVAIDYPKNLYAAIVHPQIEVKTADSKRMLKTEVSLEKAIRQWGNTAGLVAGLMKSDYPLIGRSLEDVVVEPTRSMLIPGYAEVKSLALAKGALGCGISGSGPSIFALCEGEATAQTVSDSFSDYYESLNIDHKNYVSAINTEGAKLIK